MILFYVPKHAHTH